MPFVLLLAVFSVSERLVTVAVEAWRRLESRDGRLRVVDGLGLVPREPLQVAEAGNRGGGMSPCFVGCGAGSSVFCGGLRDRLGWDPWPAAFDEARRQPLMLSLRRRDAPDEGVSGSVDVEVWAESDVSFFTRVRGPCGFILCISTSASWGLYSPESREDTCVNSPLPFGKELDEKGVAICRWGCKVGIGIGVAPWTDVSTARRLNAELLLRRCLLPLRRSLWLLSEKKLAFDAVMGVLGVLLAALFGGGVVVFRSSTSAEGAGSEEILLLNGVPNGSKFSGGSRIGCRLFVFA